MYRNFHYNSKKDVRPSCLYNVNSYTGNIAFIGKKTLGFQPLHVRNCWYPWARFVGPTWGPSGADRTQVGHMLAPWTLLSGMIHVQHSLSIIMTWSIFSNTKNVVKRGSRFNIKTVFPGTVNSTAQQSVQHNALSISLGHFYSTWWPQELTRPCYIGLCYDESRLSSQTIRATFQCEKRLFRYGNFHDKDKTVMRLVYLYNGNPYTGKTTSLYWDGPQNPSYLHGQLCQWLISITIYCSLHYFKVIFSKS